MTYDVRDPGPASGFFKNIHVSIVVTESIYNMILVRKCNPISSIKCQYNKGSRELVSLSLEINKLKVDFYLFFNFFLTISSCLKSLNIRKRPPVTT